jgi:hypothetical protein
MKFGDIFSEINLDSSIVYVIILTNLINDTHAIMNDIVYIDHMKIADVPASPS